MKYRKPRQRRPTIVTPEDGERNLEQLAARDESDAVALENFYKQDEWFRHWMAEARPANQRAQGIDVPFV